MTFWASIYRVSYGDSISANKSRLDPLNSLSELDNEVGNHMQMRLAPLSTRTKTVRVEVTRLDSLSRGFQIETPSGIQMMVSWKSAATHIPMPKPF